MQLRALLLGTLSLATVATATSASTSSTGLKNQPSEIPELNHITNVGCFNSSKGLKFAETLTFNTDGECGTLCYNKTYSVGATTDGSDCWCGNVYPPASSLTDDTECNIPCAGYDMIVCGGKNAWSVYNTGIKLEVSNYEESSSSTVSSSDTTATSTVSNSGKSTPSTVSSSNTTATSTGAAMNSTTSSSVENLGSGSKTVSITVGIVAAIFGISGAVRGIF